MLPKWLTLLAIPYIKMRKQLGK